MIREGAVRGAYSAVTMDIDDLLATRTEQMEASAICEILHAASSLGVVSLAGGLPADDSFPLAIMITEGAAQR